MRARHAVVQVGVAVGLIWLGGCRGNVQPQDRVAKAGRAAKGPPVKPPPPSSFDLVFPVGYGLSRVAIAASQDVALGPNDRVLATAGTPGTVTSAGSGGVSAGPGTSAGNIVSTGNIVLQPHVTATSAQSAGTVTLRPGDAVATVKQHATLTPLAHRSPRPAVGPHTVGEPELGHLLRVRSRVDPPEPVRRQ
ncbi:MAG TPA: hypothetical protein VMT03_06615 [Polyangia bacterium]|nr:hypothetical protein [Polyangia bacterium]